MVGYASHTSASPAHEALPATARGPSLLEATAHGLIACPLDAAAGAAGVTSRDRLGGGLAAERRTVRQTEALGDTDGAGNPDEVLWT